ncbi:MAG: cytochrome c-type biogenesis protein CcmH [Anaerolineae bacterium]|jgi:cytochrome c-type biogenesis protein CcmH|nr:cytochrome c-type biogenesis protein CcmH [Anaerolineae bacterium]MBT7074337.1 cytochrome c-type biogenesis protein CcmH [Anaerolineae bacterium]MBT7781491.1 cytochrome c-type biogenesis protein CcmH [Anaerolineae bacterium]
MKKLNILILLFIIISLFAVMPVSAQGGDDGVSDDEVNAIARDLFCPVCENTPLDVCETQACKQWRELIRLKLSEGQTEAEIKQYFVDNYGARVLDEPPKEGFNLLVYFVPPAIILVGIIVLFRAFKEWQGDDQEEYEDSSEGSIEPKRASADDDYMAQFEEELKKKK